MPLRRTAEQIREELARLREEGSERHSRAITRLLKELERLEQRSRRYALT